MTVEELAQDLWQHIDAWKKRHGRPWSRCTWATLPEFEKLMWRVVAEHAAPLVAAEARTPTSHHEIPEGGNP